MSVFCSKSAESYVWFFKENSSVAMAWNWL